MYKPELLAPAGNLEKLKIAIMYGADAVYIGGKQFSLRASASNFTLNDIKEGVNFAQQYQAKVYVVVNIIFHNDDVIGLKEYLQDLEKIGVTGVICADYLVIDYIKQYAPQLEIHISTQQSITNHHAVHFYEKLGVDRVVLGREVSYDDLQIISNNTTIELEYFVHGAMCVAYSGRCMLSNYYSKRDSNRGGCSQSCRWDYDLIKESNGKRTSLIEEDDCPFTMSSKDLALIEDIPKLIDLKIASFKIEGRMKSIYYLATIISTYRELIDEYLEKGQGFTYNDTYVNNLNKAANRSIDTGFFDNKMNSSKQLYQNRDEHPTKEFIGYVLDYDKSLGLIKIEQRNYFSVGDSVEIFGPNQEKFNLTVEQLFDENMDYLEVARHPQQIVYLKFNKVVSKHSMIRKVISK